MPEQEFIILFKSGKEVTVHELVAKGILSGSLMKDDGEELLETYTVEIGDDTYYFRVDEVAAVYPRLIKE